MRRILRGADAVEGSGRPHTPRRQRETWRDPAQSKTRCMSRHTLAREPGGPVVVCRGSWQTASRSPRTYADDARRRDVGQARSTDEPREQDRTSGGGASGGKGSGQGKLDAGTTRPGHRAGPARPARWSGYGKRQSKIGRGDSRRSCTTSTTSTACVRPTSRSKREAAPGVDGETWQHYGDGLGEHTCRTCRRG